MTLPENPPAYTGKYEYASTVNYKAIEARARLRDVQYRMGQLMMEKLYWEAILASCDK